MSFVYIDLQDSIGYRDITHLVLESSLVISTKAYNDTYHYAQNTCSFSIDYDAALFPLLLTNTNDILVKVITGTPCNITTELNESIVTEASEELLGIHGMVSFIGHALPSKSRTYNGLVDNSFFRIEATDNLDTLDVEVGDVVYFNHKVYDPYNPANSLVHKLASIAGWPSGAYNTSVTISTVIPAFAPPSEDTHVLNIIDTLLHEYGYTLNADEFNNIHPIKWLVGTSITSTHTFNDSNIIDEVSIKDTVRQYDGTKITYYALGSASNVRLFTDNNCSKNDDGTFAGYDVLAGTYYPPEANAIDPATGDYQIVYQEYTDNAIKYKTNYAVTNNLGYNYNAFNSDFSAIVATTDHYIDAKAIGLSVIQSTFYNKKCRILYKNNTSGTLPIYYNDVYGTVYYKSTERKLTSNSVAIPTSIYEYTMQYLYNATLVSEYATFIMSQYNNGQNVYSFLSEDFVEEGETVLLSLGDGSSQYGIVQDRLWKESTSQYTYTVKACSATTVSLSSQTASQNTSVETPVITSKVTPAAITIPYNSGVADYTNAAITVNIYRDGSDVSSDWAFSVVTAGCTGIFVSHNVYKITGISATTATITITASRTNWTSIVNVVVVSNGSDTAAITSAQTNAQSYADSLAAELQDDIDGKITTWYQPTAPTAGMTVGDLWIDTDDGNNQYRYNGTSWIDVQDTTISTAYNLANSKRVTWASLALAQASAVVGDYFLEGGLLYYCNYNTSSITIANSTRKTPKDWGSLATAPSGAVANDSYYNSTSVTWYVYNGVSWVVASDAISTKAYTDAISGALQTEIDGKITTWYQSSAPTSEMVEGDLWVDTDDGNNLYRYNGASWVDIQDTAISTAYNLANGKRVTWASKELAESSAVIGDYYLNAGLLYYITYAGGAFIGTEGSVDISTESGAVLVIDGPLGVRKTPKNWGSNITPPTWELVTGDSYFNTTIRAWYYYDGSAWVLDGDTVDTIQQGAIDYTNDLAAALQTEIDGKITSWYQSTAPTSGMVSGDIWIDTDDGNNQYRYNGSAWVDVQDTGIAAAYNLADTANTTANSKRVTWASLALAQANAVVGDYFIEGGILYYCNYNTSSITIENSSRKTPKNWGNLSVAPTTGIVPYDVYYNTSYLAWYYYTGSNWAIDGDGLPTTVANYAPVYRGIGILTYSTNPTYTSATVDTSGEITGGASVTANIKDWMINYASTYVATGLYYWSGSAWVASTSVAYLDSCSTDLFNLKTGGIEISGYTTIINAVIKNLMVSQLKLLTGGKLYAGNGNYNNADTPVYLDATGKMSLGNKLTFDGIDLNLTGSVNATSGVFSGEIQASSGSFCGYTITPNYIGGVDFKYNGINMLPIIGRAYFEYWSDALHSVEGTNIASITRISTGRYKVTLVNNFFTSTNNYLVLGTAYQDQVEWAAKQLLVYGEKNTRNGYNVVFWDNNTDSYQDPFVANLLFVSM